MGNRVYKENYKEVKMGKKSVLTNFIWRFLERSGSQVVAFVVSVILARILDPVVYGTIALVTVFTNLLRVFADSGFGNALTSQTRSPAQYLL